MAVLMFSSRVPGSGGDDVFAVVGAARGNGGSSPVEEISATAKGVPVAWLSRTDCTAAVAVTSMFGVGIGVPVPRIFYKRWPSSGLAHCPTERGFGSET